MAKITKEMALHYHEQGKPGKIEVVPTKPHSTQTDLSLAYSPGVAEPCLEIEKNPQDAYRYTAKGNLVAVISNGTAVLGLGDIGALAGKPVMEGKGLLFKIYSGIDVFDIEVNEKDPDKVHRGGESHRPDFRRHQPGRYQGSRMLSRSKRRLKEELDIPVMHDDQHGTAIISSAGLLNALEVAGKKIEDVKNRCERSRSLGRILHQTVCVARRTVGKHRHAGQQGCDLKRPYRPERAEALLRHQSYRHPYVGRSHQGRRRIPRLVARQCVEQGHGAQHGSVAHRVRIG